MGTSLSNRDGLIPRMSSLDTTRSPSLGMLLAPAASPWQSPEVPGTDRFQRPLQGRPSLTGGHSVAGANPRRQARHRLDLFGGITKAPRYSVLGTWALATTSAPDPYGNTITFIGNFRINY